MKKYSDLSTGKKLFRMLWMTILAFVIFFIIVFIIAMIDVSNDEPSETSTTIIETTTKAVDKEVKLLMDNAKLTEEQAKIILKDLKTVGAGKIGYCKLITDGPDKGFEVEDKDYRFIVTTKDGKTDTIYCGSILLFNYEGGALTSIKNYHLDSDEEIQFKVSAKMWVEKALKAPTTAKYNEELRVVRKNDVVTVQSSVDSQNSFGAMIRSNFTVQMSYKSEGAELLYLEIDGEALYGKPTKIN